MEIILLSLYIALYVPLIKTAATCSTIVMLNLTEEGHKLEPPVGYHKTRVVLLDAPVETSGPDGRALNVIQRSPVFCVIEDLITETNRVLNHEVAPSSRLWE